MTDLPDSAPATALHEGLLPTPEAWLSSGGVEFQEALCAWTCAYEAWARYCQRIMTCATPAGLVDAGAQFMTDSLEIYSRAAASRMRGLGAPLLSDA